MLFFFFQYHIAVLTSLVVHWHPIDVCLSISLKPESLIAYLTCFSAVREHPKLWLPTNDHQLSCINGIRVIALLYLTVGHIVGWLCILRNSYMNKQLISAIDMFNGIFGQLLWNVTWTMRLFLLMVVSIASYISERHVDIRREKFSYGKYALHRYLRLLRLIVGFIVAKHCYVSGVVRMERGNGL